MALGMGTRNVAAILAAALAIPKPTRASS
jgi:hypothetical protein